jgi:cytidine deaminase
VDAAVQEVNAVSDGMRRMPADDVDRALVAAATELLVARGRPEFNSVAAVMRTGEGEQFAAMDLRSRRSPVCAEPGALAAAQATGVSEVARIVAVCHVVETGRHEVISPCGACRELLFFHVPDAEVIVDDDGALYRVCVRDLFPFAAITGLPARPGE